MKWLTEGMFALSIGEEMDLGHLSDRWILECVHMGLISEGGATIEEFAKLRC